MSKRFRIREGSIADYGRVFVTGLVLFGVLFWTAAVEYGMF